MCVVFILCNWDMAHRVFIYVECDFGCMNIGHPCDLLTSVARPRMALLLIMLVRDLRVFLYNSPQLFCIWFCSQLIKYESERSTVHKTELRRCVRESNGSNVFLISQYCHSCRLIAMCLALCCNKATRRLPTLHGLSLTYHILLCARATSMRTARGMHPQLSLALSPNHTHGTAHRLVILTPDVTLRLTVSRTLSSF